MWVLGSNEYPQSMFSSINKKNNVYPCKPKFYYIKMGFKGSKLYRHVFVMRYGKSEQNIFTENKTPSKKKEDEKQTTFRAMSKGNGGTDRSEQTV